jgi:hypothetical protein
MKVYKRGGSILAVTSPKQITALLDTVSLAWVYVLDLAGWLMTETGCSFRSGGVLLESSRWKSAGWKCVQVLLTVCSM